MSKHAQFLLQLDSLLELEARERLQEVEEYYVNDVVMPDSPLNTRSLNRAEVEEYFRLREWQAYYASLKNDSQAAAQAQLASELLQATKRRVFNQALRLSELYLPTMVRQSSLGAWARKLLRHYHDSEDLSLVKVYLYLNLKSDLEWERDHVDPRDLRESKEDRLSDLCVDTPYDGMHQQFDLYVSSLSLAIVNHEGKRVVNQDRPDLVAA